MPYQVDAIRVGGGEYELSYGRGDAKLRTRAGLRPETSHWTTEQPFLVAHTLRELKKRWGAWARLQYHHRHGLKAEEVI